MMRKKEEMAVPAEERRSIRFDPHDWESSAQLGKGGRRRGGEGKGGRCVYTEIREERTEGRRPGTKLKGIPMAIMPSATSFELAWKTGVKIRVEKYMTINWVQ